MSGYLCFVSVGLFALYILVSLRVFNKPWLIKLDTPRVEKAGLVHLRVTERTMDKFEKAALKQGQTLTHWVSNCLTKAADASVNDTPLHNKSVS